MSIHPNVTSEVEWTNDLVIRLIEEYKNRPVLWDTTHELYRAQNAKYSAYLELANAFECDVVDLRKKLNSIFASHRREKGKVRRGERSTWFLYPYMNFLPSHLEMDDGVQQGRTKRKARDDSDDDDADNDEECLYENDLHEEVTIKQEVVEPQLRKRFRMQPHHKPRLTKTPRRLPVKEVSTSSLDNKLLEALKLLRRSELSKKKDECDTFGEYIAISLRKHDERTQSMIKQAINNILFEQEMKKYSSTQYVVISGIENENENPLTLGDNDSPEK